MQLTVLLDSAALWLCPFWFFVHLRSSYLSVAIQIYSEYQYCGLTLSIFVLCLWCFCVSFFRFLLGRLIRFSLFHLISSCGLASSQTHPGCDRSERSPDIVSKGPLGSSLPGGEPLLPLACWCWNVP